MAARGVILAAPASGSGKTVLTLGLLRALSGQFQRIGAFKVGPDYIDPAFHAAATGRPSFNIDLWAMRPATVAQILRRLDDDSDFIVGEGVMGLFDGAADNSGSTADVAALTGLPVVLVVDVRGQSASVAALLRGFMGHRADVPVAGVIFNRVGGPAHEAMLRQAVAPLGLPVLGAVPRDAALVLPDRHLGLVQAAEHDRLEEFVNHVAQRLEAAVDLQRLADLARPIQVPDLGTVMATPPLGQRIAIARDTAFSFPIRQCWRDGSGRAPISASSRRWPMRHRLTTRMPCICRAAIRSSMAAGSPPPGGSKMDFTGPPHGARRYMANVVVTWSWARRWWMPMASATPWPACCRWPPASPSGAFIWDTGRSRCRPMPPSAGPARSSAATSSTTPPSCGRTVSRCSARLTPVANPWVPWACAGARSPAPSAT
jgi:dethiobiotin synthetase